MRGKGSGSVIVADGSSNTVFQGTGVASAVNSVNITNAATTGKPSLAAQGSDTNVSLNLISKGTGTVQANAVDVVTTTGTQTLTNKDLSSTTNVFPVGSVVQMVSTNFSAVATGTTTIPHDDTIPQITEGDQYMTQAITPKSTTNKLVIEITAYLSHSAAVGVVGALFQDATANALAAAGVRNTVGTEYNMLVIKHVMTAGTVSSTTFRFRAGGDGVGTTTFNGDGGARKFGGITLSNITIIEYKA
jgi:hypothetical protein